MPRRSFLVLVFVLLNATLGMRTAYACSCVAQPSAAQAVAAAEVAFVGHVTREVGDHTYEVRVDGVLKGALPPVTTVRAEDAGSAACGTTLDLGPLLYASDRTLEVNQCTPRWQGADVAIAVAGLSVTPSPPTGQTTRPANPLDPATSGTPGWMWGLAAAATVAAGAALVLRARRGTPPTP